MSNLIWENSCTNHNRTGERMDTIFSLFDLIKMIYTFADMETIDKQIDGQIQEESPVAKAHNPNWGGRRKGAGRKPKKIERRGGKREGAGRKPIDPSGKRVRVQIYVAQSTKDKCDKLLFRGIDMSEQLTKLINEISAMMGIE